MSQVRVRDAFCGASSGMPLALLPLDVLESIGAQLSQRERVALTSCCRALWLRSDVAASPSLWGSLDLAVQPPASPSRLRMPRSKRVSSLTAFLRRHAAALRSVSMQYPDMGMWHPEVREELGTLQLLQALVGSPLASLHMCPSSTPLWELGRALGFLSTLTHLSVTWCKWRDLPAQLSVLQCLQHLDVSYNYIGCSSWAILEALTGITRLNSAACGLRWPPASLSALTALASLNLYLNLRLGDAGPLAWQPLQHLVALTELSLRNCCLTTLPRQLFCLERLATLDLYSNPFEEGIWDPLGCLTALTRLGLGDCHWEQVPQAVAGLQILAWLNLEGNWQLGRGDVPGLGLLGAVTSLNLSRCGLRYLPAESTALVSLRELDVSDNDDLAAVDSAWQPAWQMTALSKVIWRRCGQFGGPRLPPTCEYVGD